MTAQRQFQLIAGNLCLDFLNTLDYRGNPGREEELLASYADLVSFLRQSGALPERVLRKLAAHSTHEDASNRTLLRARRLREALQRIFMAMVRRNNPAPSDVDEMNAEWTRLSRHLRFQPGTDHFEWHWTDDDDGTSLDRALWPILRAAADLLTSPRLDRVRACESESCRWLFLDTSRNRSRRWCDMKLCGNRSKVRRFYQRRRVTQ